MVKKSLYKKLVRKFKSTINNYQNVNAEFDFNEFKKIISNQKEDKRYYTGIQQFLSYLKKFKDKNELNFISNKSREKYKRSLENLESLLITTLLEKETGLSAIAVKKSNFKSFVMQPFLTMLFFLQLFTKQIITARPLQANRYARQANHCENPNSDQCGDQNLDMRIYQDDLQKNSFFFAILNRKQSIEFRFKDTIFILTKDCISRQSLAKNAQGLCQSDYGWFLESMTIYHIRKKVRAEAQEQGLSLNEADVAQITQDICSIEPIQQDARQLMGMDHLENFYEPELEKFIFNAKYTLDRFQSIFAERINDNLVSRVNYAVNSEIEKRKKLAPEESKVFTSLNSDPDLRPFLETQSAISGVLQTDINTTSSIPHRSVDRFAEGFNWKIITSAAVGGIGIIVFIVAMIIWYSKKNRSENSGLATEHIPLLNSIPDSLHVLKIAGRLDKRLKSLKELDRYEDEIGVHYTSFLSLKSKEDAIKELKKIQEALTKFLVPIRRSNEAGVLNEANRMISYKLESTLLIVVSLMQRYCLLSLPNPNSSENNYITEQQKSGLRDSINSMLDNIEIIRSNFEENFFNKHNLKKDKSKLLYLNLLLNSEKAIYETMLSAHAEGYFEKYPREQIKNCLNLNINTNPMVNTDGIDLKSIKELQGDLLSTIGFILTPSNLLSDKLLRKNDDNLHGATKSFITKLVCMNNQLIAYFADYNARYDVASKSTQAQQSIEVTPVFFKPSESPNQTNLFRKLTM
ncbi:hypothetical protein [Rickettsiella endosymbiont of Xylota segnis]|uniref:hypothetical protein n=1 Tax=Rickettsiella endosymbiont of Xylota segnis TaxID=3066238 RepID=UPI0030CB5C24